MTLFKDSSNTLPSKSPIPDIVSLSLLTITDGSFIISHIEYIILVKKECNTEMREEE